MGHIFDYWTKTGILKVPKEVEDFEEFIDDLVSKPISRIKVNTALHQSNIKRGYDVNGNNYDSFAEYTFFKYKTLVENATVERNEKSESLDYYDEDNKLRKYYPDFKVNGVWCEVKGRFTEKDRCKKEQHPEVEWYFQEDINRFRQYLNQNFPDWKKDFNQTNITI